MADLSKRVQAYLSKRAELDAVYNNLIKSAESLQNKIEKIHIEQEDVINSLQAIRDVMPLLCAASMGDCISMCNIALQSIFLKPYTLIFVENNSKFILRTPDGDSDLVDGNGGGVNVVISFIFNLFLIIRTKARRIMLLDECFTQLGDGDLPRFIEFVRGLCGSLNLDILLVTHDSRITTDMVDGEYFIIDGKSEKVK
ncbi:hypothetical protein [Veillonella denticariosi]|jgi:hypothetical protein|uniref:hypothetical protein n=1 Tax=Veillonella denticariosi TaxID=419208 RepID=UPI0024924D46|nr:hypothetical protein [Veillonella denticariosi]